MRRPWKEKCQIISSIISSFWIKNTQWIVYPIRTSYGIWIWTRSDVTGRNLRRDRELERPETLFMERFLKPGMNILDIGANIGYFSTLISKLVGDKGSVTAFEPSPREQRWLKRNLALNHCKNVCIEKMGLSDYVGEIDLFVVQGLETGCNSMRKPNVNERVMPVKVKITKLDNYLLTKNLSIDFVKMDIEGAELSALKGAKSLLISVPRPVWLCELVELRAEPWGYQTVEIYDLLARSGYHWFSILSNGSLEHCARKEHFHENLVAVPEESLPLIQSLLEFK